MAIVTVMIKGTCNTRSKFLFRIPLIIDNSDVCLAVFPSLCLSVCLFVYLLVCVVHAIRLEGRELHCVQCSCNQLTLFVTSTSNDQSHPHILNIHGVSKLAYFTLFFAACPEFPAVH